MKLSIAEGLYLIAMDDEEGRLLSAAEKNIKPGVLCAIIFELILTNKLSLNGGIVKVTDPVGTGNGILDNVLNKIGEGKISDEVERLLPEFKDLEEDLNELLGQRGILKREATKILWIPLSERMNNANYAFEKEIRNILRAMVFKKAKPTPSFVILMSLIYDCNILEEVFRDKDELIDAEKVAKDMTDSIVINEETSNALKEVKAYLQGF